MIYEPFPGDIDESLECVTDDGYNVFRTFDGSLKAEHWEPVQVARVTEDKGPLVPSDFPWLSGRTIIMRKHAMEGLRDMLEEGGEILPLATDDDIELFALNVTRVLDALDEERSLVEHYDTGEIMFITAAAFHEPVIRDVPFFILPFYGSPLFIGEPLKQRVQDAGFKGMHFRMAWSSQTGALKHLVDGRCISVG